MLTYLLLAPILYLLGALPSSVLYRIADVIAFFLRDVFGYRKAVVMENIKNSFPEKSEGERTQIMRESYTHLADRIVENIKCISVSAKEVHERVHVDNIEMINDWYDQNKNAVILIGHIGSWELGTYKASIILKHKPYGLVSLLNNPYMNKMIQRTRGRFGMELVGMKHAKEFFAKPLEQLSAVVFIGDQSPGDPAKGYWTKFLNQDTCFFTGADRYAHLHNCAVLYVDVTQTSRGHYSFHLIKICDDPSVMKPNEITETYSSLLEQTLRRHPSDWLWSHKRWKHKKKI